jgi:hypothetical protein
VKALLHRHLVSSDAPLVTTGIAERAAHLLQVGAVRVCVCVCLCVYVCVCE